MQLERLNHLLDEPVDAEAWLKDWGLEDTRRAHGNLVAMASAGLTLDLMSVICDQLAEHLPALSDPDRALNNLERFVASARNPLSLGSLFERDPSALPVLLQIFSTSQHLSDVLVLDHESYDLLRMTEGQPVRREILVAELASEIDGANDENTALLALRRFKRRETLRIAYGDIIRGQRLGLVTEQLSFLADSIVDAACRFARRRLEEKRGRPLRADGHVSRFVVLGMGKLGGVELNYSSDIDLIFLYEADGRTDGSHPIGNAEFFERLARDVVRLLTEMTTLGHPYRVDLRLRPEGERGSIVHSIERAMRYYDVQGRTWERQAFVKARCVAGDLELGREFLDYLEPWVYRRYLGLADITGIKALKRRLEQRTRREGEDSLNVKTGRGGIRDIEFVIQFLQLLNGGDLRALRTGNTLEAISQLENVGCLTHQERTLLDEHYQFLRKIEHRLQIMFDLQTHLLPSDPNETRRLAIRMGYRNGANRTALQAFVSDYRQKTELNRKILDHLLHDAFGTDPQTEPEVDLVLDPDPPAERLNEVLGRHGFKDARLAYNNLLALSTEKIRFLSTRRCRHFLAAIVPRLLKEIGQTADPDSTLINLEKVSDSLGGKGVLWELFSFNPPSMKLYVDLCASNPFLSSILISNPGMIDELMDSLVLNKLPTREILSGTMAEVARGAVDLDPILHSFKNTQQLRVGVRDILGKEDIQNTMGALSDIAEICLDRITQSEYEKLVDKFGEPRIGSGEQAGQPCHFVILALGKLGGRELNYRSDLDVVFLYEADGPTVPKRARRSEPTNNQHFFSELGQRIIKAASRLGPQGRLYEIDPRLRPTGKSGPLATPLAEFTRYFGEGVGRLWERQALCKGRIVYGDALAAEQALALVQAAAYQPGFSPADAASIGEMRRRIAVGSSSADIKRGAGGIVDIEFLVQLLQLKHGQTNPALRQPNTLAALAALHAAALLSMDDFTFFTASYRFLRSIEARLRLMNVTTRDALPDDPIEQAKLAHGLGFGSVPELVARCQHFTATNAERFERVLVEQSSGEQSSG
jgi:glutamate-ammonia-ligase adenylyltransferase